MDAFRNLVENIDTKKLVAGAAIILLLVTAALVFGGDNTAELDSAPTEGTSINYDSMAKIEDGEKLFRELKGERYDMFSEDLLLFGRAAFNAYKLDETEVVGFRIKSVDIKDTTIHISGRYGASDNKITVVIELLANKRIRTSITDTRTKLNIDEILHSNNGYNTFVASLPIGTQDFTISYSEKAKGILVTLYEDTPATRATAVQMVTEAIKDGSYDTKRMRFFRQSEISD